VADAGAFGATIPSSVSTYMVGGTLTMPLWTSGRIENDIKAARLRLSEWEQERAALEQAIEQEIAQSLAERGSAEDARTATEAAVKAARESLELSRLRYGAGMATILDVVTAQYNVAQLEEDSIRVRMEWLLASARLAQARGDVRAFLADR
jgi:outer membrane protein TolC